MRRLSTTLAALSLPLALTLGGCGSDGSDDVASDPAPASTPSPSATEPAAPATVGTYPEFEPTTYDFTLTVSCFCPGAGLPIRVTVIDDEATSAVYLEGGDAANGGIAQGDEAMDGFAVTIDDVIERANDTEAAQVDVVWPDGQDYPTSVYVDGDQLVADDESGYEITDVVVG